MLNGRKRINPARLAGTLLAALMLLSMAAGARADTVPCNGGMNLPPQAIRMGGMGQSQPDLLVTGDCLVQPGDYYYGNINIYASGGSKGALKFVEASGSKTNLWASSIIIENNGSMLAGQQTPFGSLGGTLTIHLYGADQSAGNPLTKPGQGTLCQTDRANNTLPPCGIPTLQWTDNGNTLFTGNNALPGGVSDYFYQYGPLYGDNASGPNGPGYFGYKTIGVSYGATLLLEGFKGANYTPPPTDPTPLQQYNLSSGTSWARLNDGNNLSVGGRMMTLDRAVDLSGGKQNWAIGDQIVITTTDYLPGHSEQLTIDTISSAGSPPVTTIGFHLSGVNNCPPPTNAADLTCGVKWAHNGTRYKISAKLGGATTRLGLDTDLVTNGVETRAAVALLQRSIRIVSEGDQAGLAFGYHSAGNSDPLYSLGGQMVIRQGVQQLLVQGVEFYQMGQGGRMGHYPVHFHMTRQTPPGTAVKDSSVHDSMTRWYVLHSTQGVTLARDVGYLSIGHGYYLEDGTETDNSFYSNIGIFARAAVENPQNPRNIPGILANNTLGGDSFPYISDYNHPSVFWIMNGWNDFSGNMAAGAGTCGACYWLMPGDNSDMPDVLPLTPISKPAPSMQSMQDGSGPKQPSVTPTVPATPPPHMKWSGYASLQANFGMAGTTPLKSFYKNYCTSAMNAFMTTGDTAACNGVVPNGTGSPPPDQLRGVKSIAPPPVTPPPAPYPPGVGPADFETYYPRVDPGTRHPTVCPLAAQQPVNGPPAYDCSAIVANFAKCDNGNPVNCAAIVLDHFTSSFTWADTNFSALWLRQGWYLLTNSVLTDIQLAGLTFVSGGDYTQASVPQGYWALASHNIFIGSTQFDGKNQTGNFLASNAGPFNSKSGLSCVNKTSYCVNTAEGVAIQTANFGLNQRFFNIYDGPTYEDSNAFIDINQAPCSDGTCTYWGSAGVRRNPATGASYLPNAGIAWKQPNGFYYPPAFHSDNLYFSNVDIRHYVIEPLFDMGTYLTNLSDVQTNYASNINPAYFTGFTDIDRQTELNDDDGSLTGLSSTLPSKETISVNEDPFFNAALGTAECLSNIGVTPTAACAGKTPTTPSARTSPYDYVSTVIYPGCATKTLQNDPGPNACAISTGDVCTDVPINNPNPPPPTIGTYHRCTANLQRGGDWSRDCSGPYCYGVPLYRQLLTPSELALWGTNNCSQNTDPLNTKCQFPLARMSGTNTWQRSTMTLNHATYYIDTTTPKATQQHNQFAGLISDPNSVYVECEDKSVGNCSQRSVNSFAEKQAYTVFFVYAKPSTKQTYLIYVGQNFDVNSVTAVRVNISTPPFLITADSAGWPTAWTPKSQLLVKGPDGLLDMLQITVDMSGFADLNPNSATSGLCQPPSFCSGNGSSCTCGLKPTDPRVIANPSLMSECTNTCSKWAVKDLDCPKAGCIGFQVKLPGGFMSSNQYERPTPVPFPTATDPNWMVKFTRTPTTPDMSMGGQCYYSALPGTTGCNPPN